jgi:hypothetical protein
LIGIAGSHHSGIACDIIGDLDRKSIGIFNAAQLRAQG